MSRRVRNEAKVCCGMRHVGRFYVVLKEHLSSFHREPLGSNSYHNLSSYCILTSCLCLHKKEGIVLLQTLDRCLVRQPTQACGVGSTKRAFNKSKVWDRRKEISHMTLELPTRSILCILGPKRVSVRIVPLNGQHFHLDVIPTVLCSCNI